MKLEAKDIKDISGVMEYFDRTQKALSVFAEQSQGNAYLLICVEDVKEDGEKKELTHVAMGGNKKELVNAICQSMKEDVNSKAVFMEAAGKYAIARLAKLSKSSEEKEGEK